MEFDIWYCDSGLWWSGGRLCREGGWRPTKMVAAVLQPSDLRHHFRRPQRPLQGRLAASLAAAGLSGGCRSIWRQVWPLQGRLAASLVAAGLFGGKFWPLQGRCKAVTLAPLLMMLLLWNILSAIFKLCCFSSNSLQVAVSSCVVSNKNRNNAEL